MHKGFNIFALLVYFSGCLVTCQSYAQQPKVLIDKQSKSIIVTQTDGSQTSLQMMEGMDYEIITLPGSESEEASKHFHILERPNLNKPQRYLIKLSEPGMLQYSREIASVVKNQSTKQRTAMLSRQEATLKKQQSDAIKAFRQAIPGVKVHRRIQDVSNLVAITANPSDIDAIRSVPGVESVNADTVLRLSLEESAAVIQADKVWELQDSNGNPLKGSGITVAIVDSGIDYTHPALGGCLGSECRVIAGYDFAEDDDDPMDTIDHGTHVAGIVAGDSEVITGVAPQAKLLAIKVSEDGKRFLYTSNVIAGIEFAIDPDSNPHTDDGADIINLSLGSSGINELLDEAVEEAFQQGVLVVTSAGNEGEFSGMSGVIGSPGSAASALTVGSVRLNGSTSSFSSHGPVDDADYIKPEVMAPGEGIYSSTLDGEYAALSGTSMAAPHVSGIAALLTQALPDSSKSEIKSRLISASRTQRFDDSDWYSDFPSAHYVGAGVVNALKSLTNTVVIDKPIVYLGRVDVSQASWVQSVVLVVHNQGSESEELTLSLTGVREEVAASLSTDTLTVASGGSETVTLEVAINPDELNYTGIGVGSRNFRIEVYNDNNELQIPVVFDHYNELKIVDDGSLSFGFIYAGDRFLDSFFNLNSDESKEHEFKIPRSVVDVRSSLDVENTYLDDDSVDPGNRTVKQGFVIYNDLDITGGAEIHIGLDALKHKVSVDQFLVNGEPLDFTTVQLWSSQYGIYLDGEGVFGGIGWTFCHDDTCFTRPSEFWFSDVQGELSTEIHDVVHKIVDSENTELYSIVHKYENIVGSVEQEISAISQPVEMHYDFPEKEPLAFSTEGLITALGNTQNVKLYYNDFLTGRPYTEVQLYLAEREGRSLASTNIYDSGRFRLQPDLKLEKYQLTEPRNIYASDRSYEMESYFASPDLALTTDSKLLYWSANTDLREFYVASGFGLRRQGGLAGDSTERGFVRDIWQQQFFEGTGIFAETCDGEHLPVAELPGLNFSHYHLFWMLDTSDCNQFKFTYGLVEKDEHGTATYLFSEDNEGDLFASLSAMKLINNQRLSESVDSINHKLSFSVNAPDETSVASVRVLTQIDESDDWQEVYANSGAGIHAVFFPLPQQEQRVSLKLELESDNGNLFINEIPNAITLLPAVNSVENDVMAPVILAPESIVFESQSFDGLLLTDPLIADFLSGVTATDNLDGDVEVSYEAPESFPPGITGVSFFAVDTSGNQTRHDIQITVKIYDKTGPVISVPRPGFAESPNNTGLSADSPEIDAWLDSATAVDAVEGNVDVVNYAPDHFETGINYVWFFAQDSRGNYSYEFSTFTIERRVVGEKPQLTVPDPITIFTEDENGVPKDAVAIRTFLSGARVTDDGDSIPTIYHFAPDIFPPGVTEVDFQVTDIDLNTVTGTSRVKVVLPGFDTTEPQITVPEDTQITITNGVGLNVDDDRIENFLNQAFAWDETDYSINITNNAPGVFPLGETEVTFSASDVSGNEISAIAILTLVQDDSVPIQRATAHDYDADGKADIAVRRVSNTMQYIKKSIDGNISRVFFARNENDIPVSGDFDGDKITDIAVFRPDTGEWLIRNSSGVDLISGNRNGMTRIVFAQYPGEGDIPVPADYDGDGITDLAVRFTKYNNGFYIRNSSGLDLVNGSSSGNTRIISGSQDEDIPVVADYDGDGRADIAVRRPSRQIFYIRNSSGVDHLTGNADGITRRKFGNHKTDIPVTGDFDGDGRADLAVRRASNSHWYILNSSGTNYNSARMDGIQRIQFGAEINDIPIVADYDGDGITDIAVRRPGSFTQFIRQSSDSSEQQIRFGLNENDIPIAAPVSLVMDMVADN